MTAPIRLVVETGPNAGQTFAVESGSTTIGRQDGNTIVLDDARLSRQHLRLDITSTGISVTDLGSANGTRVNGRSVVGATPLQPGDRLQLGETTILIEQTAATAPARAGNQEATIIADQSGAGGTAGARLVLQNTGQSIPLNRASLVAGRQADVDIVLEDTQASRRHARFDVQRDQVTVTDLGSANGTRVNGRPIGEPTPLQTGDIVQIGTTLLRAEGIAGPAYAAAPGVGAATVVAPGVGGPPSPFPPPGGPVPPSPPFQATAPQRPIPPPQRSSKLPLVLGLVGVLALLVCGAGGLGAFLFVRSQTPSATATTGRGPQGTAVVSGLAGTATAIAGVTGAVAGASGGNAAPPPPGASIAPVAIPSAPPQPTPTTAAAPTATTPRPSPTPARPTATVARPPATAPPTTGGNTFTVTSVGLRFNVPQGWTKVDEQAGQVTFRSPNQQAIYIVRWGQATAGQTGQTILQQELQATANTDPTFNASGVEITPTTVGGQPGFGTDRYTYANRSGTRVTEVDASVVIPNRFQYFFGFLATEAQFQANSQDFAFIANSIQITPP